MKSTGMFRPIDNLGRITIPMSIRKSLAIEPGTRLEISVKNRTICLRPENVRLTLDELEMMVGEPVFVVPQDTKDKALFGDHWCVMEDDGAMIPGCEYTYWNIKDYGDLWLAYRQRTTTDEKEK